MTHTTSELINPNIESNPSVSIWLSALLILLFLTTLCGIFDHDLWPPEETRAAELGREFMDHDNWAVATLNSQPFIEKPPLVYWAIALSLKIFGIHDWAARIPCILFGWGILIFTYLLARRLYGKGVGIGSILVLATTSGFLVMSHRIECDTGLFFFVTGAAYFLYRAFTGSARWYGLVYIFALGGFFSKGFIAFVFLGLLFLAWIIWNRNPKEILRAKPWLWCPLMFIPMLIWLIGISRYPQDNLLFTFLIGNHLYRFSTSGPYHFGNIRPFYFYFITLPTQFLPWILILLASLPWLWRQRQDKTTKFLLCWFLPGFLFLSVAGTKNESYLVPILPPLAMMVAAWFYAKSRERWLKTLVTLLALVIVIGCFIAIPRINKQVSFRPFGKKLATMIGPDTKLYGFMPNEALSSVVPFYTKRYFTPIKQESELPGLAQQPDTEIVMVFIEKHTPDQYFKTVNKYFPYIWADKIVKHQHIWALSNVAKKY